MYKCIMASQYRLIKKYIYIYIERERGGFICIYIYTGSAKKMYTHFNRWYLCIVFEVELNYHYNM